MKSNIPQNSINMLHITFEVRHFFTKSVIHLRKSPMNNPFLIINNFNLKVKLTETRIVNTITQHVRTMSSSYFLAKKKFIPTTWSIDQGIIYIRKIKIEMLPLAFWVWCQFFFYKTRDLSKFSTWLTIIQEFYRRNTLRIYMHSCDKEMTREIWNQKHN